jgi:cysteinyl-tRNA synthetase
MSIGCLGTAFDIHGGGADLVFPHHENEVAQSEAATGEPFARYWLHGGMLNINAEKMSKSLGNFVVLKDVLARHPADVFRLLALQTHYRSPLDFSGDRLDESHAALERLQNVVYNLGEAIAAGPTPSATEERLDVPLRAAVEQARAKFVSAMDDDFNTAGALAAVFELAKTTNGLVERRWGFHADEIEALGAARPTSITPARGVNANASA